MKRLWIAVLLLTTVVGLCVLTGVYLHRSMDRMLNTLDELEQVCTDGDMGRASELAEQLGRDYQQVSNILDCFIPHDDMAQSKETVALLPVLLRRGGEEELRMEIERLREEFQHLQSIDDVVWRNIL